MACIGGRAAFFVQHPGDGGQHRPVEPEDGHHVGHHYTTPTYSSRLAPHMYQVFMNMLMVRLP